MRKPLLIKQQNEKIEWFCFFLLIPSILRTVTGGGGASIEEGV